jgi:hypothetical protein
MQRVLPSWMERAWTIPILSAVPEEKTRKFRQNGVNTFSRTNDMPLRQTDGQHGERLRGLFTQF